MATTEADTLPVQIPQASPEAAAEAVQTAGNILSLRYLSPEKEARKGLDKVLLALNTDTSLSNTQLPAIKPSVQQVVESTPQVSQEETREQILARENFFKEQALAGISLIPSTEDMLNKIAAAPAVTEPAPEAQSSPLETVAEETPAPMAVDQPTSVISTDTDLMTRIGVVREKLHTIFNHFRRMSATDSQTNMEASVLRAILANIDDLFVGDAGRSYIFSLNANGDEIIVSRTRSRAIYTLGINKIKEGDHEGKKEEFMINIVAPRSEAPYIVDTVDLSCNFTESQRQIGIKCSSFNSRAEQKS